MESDSPDNERGLEEKEPVLADSEQATCLCLQFILQYKMHIYIHTYIYLNVGRARVLCKLA